MRNRAGDNDEGPRLVVLLTATVLLVADLVLQINALYPSDHPTDPVMGSRRLDIHPRP